MKKHNFEITLVCSIVAAMGGFLIAAYALAPTPEERRFLEREKLHEETRRRVTVLGLDLMGYGVDDQRELQALLDSYIRRVADQQIEKSKQRDKK